MSDDTQPASYAAAEEELDRILRSLEDDDVDVDQLSEQVARARDLITWCRGRLATAEVSITELLDDDADAGVSPEPTPTAQPEPPQS